MVIYLVEAHPTDKWWFGESRLVRMLHGKFNSLAAIDIKDPVNMEERKKVAASCQERLFGDMPTYVDTMDDTVKDLYTARPTRIYLIGKDGKVAFNQGTGPHSFSPDGLEPAIEEYLANQ